MNAYEKDSHTLRKLNNHSRDKSKSAANTEHPDRHTDELEIQSACGKGLNTGKKPWTDGAAMGYVQLFVSSSQITTHPVIEKHLL